MRKIFMTAVALLFCALTMMAQDGEAERNKMYRVTLGKIQYAHHNEKMSTNDAVGKALTGLVTGKIEVQATKYESDVKNAIIRGLSSAYRFRYNNLLEVADLVGDGNIVADAEITNIQAKSETRREYKNYNDLKDVKDIKDINDLKKKENETKLTSYYNGIVDMTLTLKDAKTGEVIATPSFSCSGSGNSDNSTVDKAIRGAINRLSGQISSWLNKYRPLEANIVEGATAKKDKQKEVYIDLGSREGAFPGLHMNVYLVDDSDGYESTIEVGRLKVEAVEGEDLSRCKIQNGGKDIKACLDAEAYLKVISVY